MSPRLQEKYGKGALECVTLRGASLGQQHPGQQQHSSGMARGMHARPWLFAF